VSGVTGVTPDARRAEIEAARLLLDRLGVSPADLLAAPGASEIPRLADYIPRVATAVGPGTRKVYGSYWNLVLRTWGERRLTEITALEISALCEQARTTAVARRNGRGGRSAAEHLTGALRCVYSHAVADQIITASQNPAARVAKPRRLPSTRRALPDQQVQQITQVAGSTGNDPELDALLIRLHLETACRRGGALALTRQDLDPEQCLIRLREKGGTIRWQPVSPTLMAGLLAHWNTRGVGDSSEQMLRYASGRPITARRYDHLWQRLGRYLPWVATQQISTHWLRHTTLTWVERNFGHAVAQAYAGHLSDGRDSSATATYVRAGVTEVAAALTALTSEPHPLRPDL
jgi:integrase